MTAMRKYELAAMLRGMGYSYLDIAAELYPRDYEEYLRTRDRRLYQTLKRRVWKLLRLAGGPRDNSLEDPVPGWTPELGLDDSGGERHTLGARAPEPILHPRTRKAGKRGAERQALEYEQLLYYYYNRILSRIDSNYTLWATIKALHGRAFNVFYERFGENVWRPRRAGRLARAYAYSVILVALMLHGLSDVRMREMLARDLRVDRDALKEVLPVVMAEVI